ncbi:peptidase domain-containing ABC transporter [Methylophilus luteus]|uniref:Peptidase domain-containing ABC transporter n=1 Tax=Methylophilus luteus TaxID=640108 RepID=A0ABW3F766_9PROT
MWFKRQFPVVLQDETYECGLACLAAIAQHYGQTVKLKSLRLRYDITSNGLTIYHLIKVAANLGMAARGVKLEAEDLDQLRCPAILLWNHNHFVVLVACSKKTIDIMDPGVGLRRYSRTEASARFSGVALDILAVENNAAEALPLEQSSEQKFSYGWPDFRKAFFKYPAYLYPMIVFGVLAQTITLVMPKFVSLAVDEVLGKQDKEFLSLLLYIFGTLALVQLVALFLKNALISRLRADISEWHGAKIVQSLLQMPLIYFSRRSAANLLRKVRAIDSIHVAYTQGYIEIGISFLSVAAISILLLLVHPMLGGTVVVIAIGLLIIRHVALQRMMQLKEGVIEAEVKRDLQLLAAVRTIRSIKLKGLSFIHTSNWLSEHMSLESYRIKLDHMLENLGAFSTVLTSAMTLLLLSIGASLALEGEITTGALFATLLYTALLMNAINTMVMSHHAVKMALVETNKLHDITPSSLQIPDISSYASSVAAVESWHSTQLQGISFAYTNLDVPILNALDFKIAYGEKVCIRGQSGAGKTTLINLICGLLKPTAGQIYMNDIALDRHGHELLRSAVAVSSFDDEIVDGTVIDNILFGNIDLDPDRFEYAVETAGMRSMIPQLQHGLNTRIGSTGAGLSSGQRQRLMLARALYQLPRLLILDEPTSHLDDINTDTIIASLNSLTMATLIITHDKRVEAICDHHYLLDGGTLTMLSQHKSTT